MLLTYLLKSCLFSFTSLNTLILFAVVKSLDPVKMTKWGTVEVNYETMETNAPGVFCGGDLAGVAQTTVESVNDGKTAAWYMHKYLQVCAQSGYLFLGPFIL